MSMLKRSDFEVPARNKRSTRKAHNSYRGDIQNRRPKKYTRQKFASSIGEDDDFYSGR